MPVDEECKVPDDWTGLYILADHTPMPTKDIVAWGRQLNSVARRVGFTEVAKGVTVSTVFLGVDHAFMEGPPVLFETMVFGGPMDRAQYRYNTWGEAEAGHRHVVAQVRASWEKEQWPT